MFQARSIPFIIALCTHAALSCANMSTTKCVSNVDAFADANALLKKRYIIFPGEKKVSQYDLQFREFAAYTEKILAEKGFVKAENFEKSDITIFLVYTIGDPQTEEHTYTAPAWVQTGIKAETHETIFSRETTFTPTYGLRWTTQVETSTVYTRMLFLTAYDTRAYIETGKTAEVWKTSAFSTGSSSDLREVFPYMILAIKPYIGTSSGRKVPVEISLDDPMVRNFINKPALDSK